MDAERYAGMADRARPAGRVLVRQRRRALTDELFEINSSTKCASVMI